MRSHTDGFQDLYRIMQVDHLAEPEVIEGAYKRLSKKYHPDANKDAGSELKMKQINYAYSVLRVAGKRSEYDLRYRHWLAEKEKQSGRERGKPERRWVENAGLILKEYFSNLAEGKLEEAYALVSDEDKKYISQADFFEWQTLVTSLYEIGDFDCSFFKTITGKAIGTKAFIQMFEFQISLAERERSSGKVNHTEFSRLVALEKDALKMYLGYKDIRTIIDKFKRLSTETSDPDEYGYDKAELQKAIEKEIARAKRYERPVSMVLLETIGAPPAETSGEYEEYETVFKEILSEIKCNIRTTDYCGRWGRNRIAVILTETRSFGAGKTTEKLFNVIRMAQAKKSLKEPIIFSAGVVHYKQTCFQEMMDVLNSNVISAKKKGEWRMVF